MKEIIVVGAGLVGTAIARRLADRDVRVTLLEASRPAGGTSLATFAWVNALGKKPQHYFELNLAGVSEHRSLVDELGDGSWYHPGGHLEWSSAGERLRDKVESGRSLGYAASLVSRAKALELEPDANIADGDTAAFYPDEAWVDPVVLVGRLLDHPGLELRIGEVERLEWAGARFGGVVLSDGSRLAADAVVVATGPRAAELAKEAGMELPMRDAPGLLAVTEPAPVRIGHVLHGPGIAIRPDGAGRLLLASDELDKRIEPSGGDLPVAAAADELLARARQALRHLGDLGIEATRIGRRALTADGLPAIGPIPGCEGAYLAVMHSGITLGPLVGRLVAGELADGVHDAHLAPYRPQRFNTDSS